MKKFLKSLIYVFAFALLLLSGIFSCSAINKTSSATTETTKTVNFYGSDNETVIYSLDVPYGETLQSLEDNNLLSNSDFSDSSSNSWYTTNSNTTLRYLENGGLLIANNVSNGYIWQELGNISNYSNQDITFSALVNGVYYSTSGKLPASATEGTQILIGSRSLDIPNSAACNIYVRPTGTIICQFGVISGNSYIISYAKVEKGLTATPYFNSDYVNKLYINSGGVISSSFEWSESKTSSSRFTFDTPITSDINLYGFTPKGEVFNSEADLAFDVASISNYAISGIEFLEVNGTFLYHLSYKDRAPNFLRLFSSSLFSSNFTLETNNFVYNCVNSLENFNFFVCTESESSYFTVSASSGSSYLFLSKNFISDSIHIYFSTAEFVPTSYNTFNLVFDTDYSKNMKYRYYDDIDSVVDMDSDTNYSVDFKSDAFAGGTFNAAFSSNFYDYENIIGWNVENPSINNDSISKFSYFNNGSLFVIDSLSGSYSIASFGVFSGGVINEPIFYELDFYLNDFFFFVHRPFYRVDNTLIIYNFDYYNALDKVNGITYQLQKDGNFYNINYNNVLPNDYIIYLSSPEYANTIFDEYVSVYIKFIGNSIPLTKLDNFSYSYDLGFDFNFVYYVEPLVSNNGVYNYTFDKPGYVEMSFSLVPFHLPVLEAVENAMIFLVFYCPIISDVLSFLHFDMFFGGLLQIVSFVLGSAIGSFVLGCLAFLIYWSILKSLFPQVKSTGKAIYNDSQFAYNRKKDREYKLKAKEKSKEFKYKMSKSKKR